MGTCAWGGDVTIKKGSTTLETFNTNTGVCYHQDKVNNIAFTVIVLDEVSTLTVSGGSYTPYFAVEVTDYVPNYKTVTYSIGETGASGVVPAAVTKDINISNTTTIPSNFTLYKEGYTLTGWTDGVNTYNVGDTYTISENVTLTPIFTETTYSVKDRLAEATVTWNFRRDQGAPSVAWESASGDGHLWVAQTIVGGRTIDVKTDLDANPGKFNNASNTDWAQINSGTTFTIPAVNGMKVTFVTYNAITTTTIDGSSDYDAASSGSTGNYSTTKTYSGSKNEIEIVIGNGTYYRYITVLYPAPETVTISPAKEFTTYCSTSPLNFTAVEGLEAYVVTGSTTSTITLAKVTDVPAGTGLILKKTGSAASYNVPVGTATSLAETNKLVGVTEATTFTAGDYILSNGTFIRGTAGTLAAGKAYLPAANVTAGSHELLLDFGGTTGIAEMKAVRTIEDGKFYNLAGQQVATPAKGLYIVNGKKVIIK